MSDFGDPIVSSPAATDTAFETSTFQVYSPVSSPAGVIHRQDGDRKEDDGSTEEGSAALVAYRHQSPATSSTTSTSSLRPHLAMIAPCPVGSPLLEFCAPAFQEFSDRPNRRALVDHFCNVLSHLIVFREESGNPFQQLVLPLTRQSSPVMNAIYALASAHLEYRGVDNMEKSLYFHNRAIQGLAQLIDLNDKTDRNEILAAIMLLVYYEVLVQKGRSNIVHGHLKGALTVMCTNPEPSDATSVFLERAFRFYDVIAALSNGTAPLSVAPAPGCLLPFPPLGALAASPLSNVDTLLGMATTLWPIIHRLSSLLSLKSELEQAIRSNAMSSKIAVLRMEFESTADAIETALTQWRPHLPPGFVADEKEMNDPTFITANTTATDNDDDVDDNTNEKDDDKNDDITNTDAAAAASNKGDSPPPPTTPPTSFNNDNSGTTAPSSSGERDGRIHSILHNALAYRHSAFVYLYRTIYAHRRSHHAVQTHAHLSLMHCVATVCHAGPMGALLWPLFVAACEAVDAKDRELAGRAFAAIKKRQGMMNIERAWEIVQEVWRRADLAEQRETEEDRNEDEVMMLSPDDDAVEAATTTGKTHRKDHLDSDAVAPAAAPADLWRQVSKDMGVNIVFG
ncbi:fungal-specific transcription factor domain-containing protein [Apodospora peruviana]|uniref:Fungal-specific transcription factor domain-containing protein n=1 Tax=Apodospora peruviana TaxID=516989 RepID=A0AAE0M1I4_9PEZI|nr:fungal-specific transcription factor domain-containing protein [Apodospora peruviana]